MVNVTLDEYFLEIADDATSNVINTISYAAIDTIYPITSVQLYRDAPVLMGEPEETERVEEFHVEILLRDGHKERIQLSNVTNQAEWTNDAAGAWACVKDIYAAMGG